LRKTYVIKGLWSSPVKFADGDCAIERRMVAAARRVIANSAGMPTFRTTSLDERFSEQRARFPALEATNNKSPGRARLYSGFVVYNAESQN
jgi:hypothetical protein